MRIRISFLQKDRTPDVNNRYRTILMVHMKSVLVTIVSAKTKYYEKLIISQQIISVRSNVITECQSGSTVAMKTANHKLPNYCTD